MGTPPAGAGEAGGHRRQWGRSSGGGQAYRNYLGAIGFSFRFYASEMAANRQIKLLALEGVAPTKESIRDGSYPIASSFYAVTASPIGEPAPEETDGDLAAFLAWIRSPEGQELVEKTGYVGVGQEELR